MTTKPTMTINVHVKDDTWTGAHRVPSSDKDFVSLSIGPDLSILLFNSMQAQALIQSAISAHRILKTIELDIEEALMIANFDDKEDDSVVCTIDNPCQSCLEFNWTVSNLKETT